MQTWGRGSKQTIGGRVELNHTGMHGPGCWITAMGSNHLPVASADRLVEQGFQALDIVLFHIGFFVFAKLSARGVGIRLFLVGLDAF